MGDLVSLAWPLTDLGEALEALAQQSGLKPASGDISMSLKAADILASESHEELDKCLDWAGAQLGIEVESIATTGDELMTLLEGAGPALLRYRINNQSYVLLLLKATRRTARLIGPDLRVKKRSLVSVYKSLTANIESELLPEIEGLLQHANILKTRWSRTKSALLQQRMAGQHLDGFWMLRIPPGGDFKTQLSYDQLPKLVIIMMLVFAIVYALETTGWVLIGRGALSGRLDSGWLLAWALLLLSMVPLQIWGSWLQGMFSIKFATLLKQRLLSGALKMNIDSVRQQGTGQLLGQVIESSAFDSLALNGGFSVLIATIELCIAGWILAIGAGGGWHVVLLFLWLFVTFGFILFYYRHLRRWTKKRLELTHNLVEHMAGHRTRLAQESPECRHNSEDQCLEQYVTISRNFDKAFVPLVGGLPRGWLILGLLGLSPEVIFGNAEAIGLTIGFGGILLAYRAFGEIASGLSALAQAIVAWEQVAPLFLAAKENVDSKSPCPVIQDKDLNSGSDKTSTAILQARSLVYRYRPQTEAVLTNCDLTIHRGDRLLVEGPSGGGKSTLAALLVGLRRPESGLLLLDGLDQATLGDGWKQRSTSAPQFHENHVLSATMAFNLLMGRRWPPNANDLAEADSLCRELGLGNLLDRMPSGLMQMVGETGWQLSHGERSRLYLARALLQKSQLVVLDESFAALDPETLDLCLECSLSKASTLVVIAHP